MAERTLAPPFEAELHVRADEVALIPWLAVGSVSAAMLIGTAVISAAVAAASPLLRLRAIAPR